MLRGVALLIRKTLAVFLIGVPDLPFLLLELLLFVNLKLRLNIHLRLWVFLCFLLFYRY